MLKRIFSFLIFLALMIPSGLASAVTCSSDSSSDTSSSSSTVVSLKLRLTALYANPNTGESEWIEIINNDKSTVDLSLYTLEDATAKPWTPSGSLAAGKSAQITGFPFQLNNSDETVTLKTKDGTVVDTWTYASTVKGQALSRDASETTETSAEETPAQESPAETPVTPTTPAKWPSFSEVLPNPEGSDSTEEWIELYNPYGEALSLEGLKIDDEDGGSSPHALSGTLAAESYLFLSIQDTNITLNNTEDHVRLLGVNGEILWDIVYSDPQEGWSYAQFENAQAWTSHPTPGEENVAEATASSSETDASSESSTEASTDSTYQNGDLSEEVEITEVFPNPEGPDQKEEWIELTNFSNVPLNLGNWTLDDGEGGSDPFTFPDNFILQPGESVVIYRTETGLALNNSNESIQLLDYNGEIMSDIEYETSEEGKSYSEIQVEEASSQQASLVDLGAAAHTLWAWVDPTPGSSNPIWKQIKGDVTDFDGQFLTLFDGLSSWTFETSSSATNGLLYTVGNTLLVKASLNPNDLYEVMEAELIANAQKTSTTHFPWLTLLLGMGVTGWVGYEIYKKKSQNTLNFNATALN